MTNMKSYVAYQMATTFIQRSM